MYVRSIRSMQSFKFIWTEQYGTGWSFIDDRRSYFKNIKKYKNLKDALNMTRSLLFSKPQKYNVTITMTPIKNFVINYKKKPNKL